MKPCRCNHCKRCIRRINARQYRQSIAEESRIRQALDFCRYNYGPSDFRSSLAPELTDRIINPYVSVFGRDRGIPLGYLP